MVEELEEERLVALAKQVASVARDLRAALAACQVVHVVRAVVGVRLAAADDASDTVEELEEGRLVALVVIPAVAAMRVRRVMLRSREAGGGAWQRRARTTVPPAAHSRSAKYGDGGIARSCPHWQRRGPSRDLTARLCAGGGT